MDFREFCAWALCAVFASSSMILWYALRHTGLTLEILACECEDLADERDALVKESNQARLHVEDLRKQFIRYEAECQARQLELTERSTEYLDD